AASGRLKVAPTTPFFSLMGFLQRIKTVVLLSKSIHAIALPTPATLRQRLDAAVFFVRKTNRQRWHFISPVTGLPQSA
ncbi:MAG: hypothetical protein LBV49_03510, partial [Azonexus sp.]|nr:hypothetical protein [Azonexus sp.]